MKRSVYIETSVIAYYYETRTDTRAVAWKEITREWWKKYRSYYETITSDVVPYELGHGSHPMQKEKITLAERITRLPRMPVIDDIVAEYIRQRLVPQEYFGDGYHLAFASYYNVDFLLTWNCAHLANPNKFQHMRVVNARLNLQLPIICTPEQLLTKGDME